MSKLAAALQGKKVFAPFITAGDPDLETTKKLILALEKAGASLVELGIPFSDPMAEGPVIQAADLRALSNGCTTDKVFDMIAEVRKETDIPLVFLTYANPIFHYGTDKFYRRCAETGVDGTIVPDVPYEEREELEGACRKYGVDRIVMIAPTSDDRIQMLAKDAKGYIYRDAIVMTVLGIIAGVGLGTVMGGLTVGAVEWQTCSFMKDPDLPSCLLGAGVSAFFAVAMMIVALRRIPRFSLTDISKF